MPFQQRDIVKVKRPLPGGQELTHPFLIISNERANTHERSEKTYIGVMITHSQIQDKFSYPIDAGMVDGRIDRDCQVRLHIIAFFRESDISRDSTAYVGKMKKIYFEAILENIKNNVLSVDS